MAEKDSAIFINRELSWLEFNRRVLDLSKKRGVPLGEQLNFAAIYGSNLDEFFMIRVGSLYDQTLLKSEIKENKTKMTPKQQLTAIMPLVAELQETCDKDVKKLIEKLKKQDIEKIDFDNLTGDQGAFWKKYFMRELFPVLSPQVIDRRHPFPFLRDREIYVGAILKDKKADNPLFGLIPVGNQFERLLRVQKDEKLCYALVEELILHHVNEVFGESEVQAACLFRVTRNADINVQEGMFDHDIDYREVMSELLKKRRKLAAVRLQFYKEAPQPILDYLRKVLMVPEDQCFVQSTPLEMSYLFILRSMLEKRNNEELFFPVAKPVPFSSDFSLYEAVQQKNILLHYPYQSIRSFIQMLHDAANDPEVISIKMTLYRVASESKIIDELITAAENGKEVVTIVELRARFDEQNNIDWSRQLEQAGCTVIYGFSDYKVHSKLTLITRKRGTKYEYISQIGTGNYNEKTSELYTDLSYITSDTETGEEVGAVFNNLALERFTEHVDSLIVAPLRFKSVLLGEIQEEIRYQQEDGAGRVMIKCNSISDKEIIETLTEASQAGVDIDMVVRGICCLRAGIPGLTENIHIRSIVGRYLEHSRIYAFGEGSRLRTYIASGDFLTRNTERRVEVGVKIEDPEIQKILVDILEMEFADNVNAREMQPDGSYTWVETQKEDPRIDSQMAFYPYLEKLLPDIEKVDGTAKPGPEKPEKIQPQQPPENKPTEIKTEENAGRGFFNRLRRFFTGKS